MMKEQHRGLRTTIVRFSSHNALIKQRKRKRNKEVCW